MKRAKRLLRKGKEIVGTHLRRKRFSLFLSLLAPLDGPITILDVGGTPRFRERMRFTPPHNVKITLLNSCASELSRPFRNVMGDACRMPFESAEFDIVFSNSAIEHVGDYAYQSRMAGEIRRVGKRYFVQTPNRYFPIEPHFAVPLFQFLPFAVRVQLLTLSRLR